jgi:hypothetical protein
MCLHLDHPLERDPVRAIARPVGEQERRHARIADRADVRAAIAQPDERERMRQHLAHDVEVAAGVVVDREVEQCPALVLEQRVVDPREHGHGHACAHRVGGEAAVELRLELRYWLYRHYEKQHTDVVGIFVVRELETIKSYHDSWQVSGGLRLHDVARAPGLELMAGTHYDRTPAPPGTVTLDQPTFNHIGLHTGARWSTGRYRFGPSYLHYWYDVATVTTR